jgi:hypothetical protein
MLWGTVFRKRSQKGQLRCLRATRSLSLLRGRCPLDPVRYGFLFSVRQMQIANVAYNVLAA